MPAVYGEPKENTRRILIASDSYSQNPSTPYKSRTSQFLTATASAFSLTSFYATFLSRDTASTAKALKAQ
jgi:hypothetical protein